MIDRDMKVNICCITEEEQNMMLDIFEMLGMRWRAGQIPRGYRCRYKLPMFFQLDGDGKFGEAQQCYKHFNASDLYNQWVSLKINNADKITVVEEDDDEDDWGL